MILEHRHPDCPGTWTRERTAWRCSACRAVYYQAADVDLEAELLAAVDAVLAQLGPGTHGSGG